ncbi:hypothetical protein H072_532 [Dactylellina haptotyla CBS 200.50]|uniref:EXPERA domain-containing protein n=1 Tax=Dactylellina haptotyla (strain CBS 200.50) TaxID=1284197 RepID=S8C169_DACHA|nr:hypothetical protein H072_532 [Dactylellina haptotyla CBS 200.50]
MVVTRSSAASITARSLPQTKTWSHTPSPLFLLWLCISLPLVMWDFTYVFLRPHSMPGGKWHLPWTPYSIYCEVDLVYGFKHYEDGEGFNPAQSTLNILETAMYLYYLYLVRNYRGVQKKGEHVGIFGERKMYGKDAAKAVLWGLVPCVATFWKTVLYWLQEILGQYKNIGHNSPNVLFWFWIVPNSPWMILPGYMIYIFGKEIVDGLAIASMEAESNGIANGVTKEE